MVRVHAGPRMRDEVMGLSLSGGLAQLARAPALQAGGQRFESVILHGGKGAHRAYRMAIVQAIAQVL